LGRDGTQFKKDLTTIIKERSVEQFDIKFEEFKKKFNKEETEESSTDTESSSEEENKKSRAKKGKKYQKKKQKKQNKKDNEASNLKKITQYLEDLYEERQHWAFCYTHTTFTAGNLLSV
jgi:hypothetical protein